MTPWIESRTHRIGKTLYDTSQALSVILALLGKFIEVPILEIYQRSEREREREKNEGKRGGRICVNKKK